MKKIFYILIFLVLCKGSANAQCPGGQDSVTIEVMTDDYGYEIYWELLPALNACGVGTIYSGGNNAVGCAGGGLQLQAPGGYGNNLTINAGGWCLTSGADYKIMFIDDWGDGGAHFTVNINGFPVYAELTGDGNGVGTTLPFTVTPPLAYDMDAHHITTNSYVNPGNVDIKGHLFNRSSNTITDMDINYQIDMGAPVTTNITGLNILPFTDYYFTHPTPWNVLVNGSYTVKAWASNLNGNVDMDNNNDTIYKTIVVGPPTPNIMANYIGIIPQKTVIAGTAEGILVPRDLDFHPILTNYDLWVILKSTEANGGKTVKISNAGQVGQTELLQQDDNAYHFMSLPTGIAFSENENFATSPGVYDANHDGGNPFTGPTLWDSDPSVYAQPSGGNGSHIDMLHESPYSMGIAHEKDNAFWLNDGQNNCITRYDFAEDHGAGMSDHSDGIIRRYTGLGLVEDPTHHVVSHLVLDKTTGWLYVVDSENDRVIRMDINTGSATGTFTPYENPAEASVFTGFTFSDYITTGLARPSGIDIIGDTLIVSDYSTGEIVMYNCSGATGIELFRIQTNTPGVMGVKIGPDGNIWYVNATTNQVVRLETIDVTGMDNNEFLFVNIYPNPASDVVNLKFNNDNYMDATVSISNISGQIMLSKNISGQNEMFDVSSFSNGVYFVNVSGPQISTTKKIIIQ